MVSRLKPDFLKGMRLMNNTNQRSWSARAEVVLPAGGFGNFDPAIIIRNGKGAVVWDEDGNEYVDFLIGSGPMMLGHGHPEVLAAVKEQCEKGMTFFANNTAGIELAEEICNAVTAAEQLRYVSTGGEADMYAMRLARAYTKRDKIIKFEGGYHGMSSESLMSLAPTTLKDFPAAVPDSAGIPDSVRDNMLIAPFNDGDYVVQLIEQYKSEVAAIIVEPLQRLIPPAPGFLQLLREQASKYGIVLIFDEVVTGFRLAYGGAQELYGVIPDLCTLGKVIGGGFPLAAIAGKSEIMAHFDQNKAGAGGFTYQIGTLSGNPVAAMAGLKTLEIMKRSGGYEKLRENGDFVMQSITKHLSKAGIPHQLVGDPVLFDVVFTSQNAVQDYRDFISCDFGRARQFNQLLREQGILKPDTKFYISLALTTENLDRADAAISYAAARLSG